MATPISVELYPMPNPLPAIIATVLLFMSAGVNAAQADIDAELAEYSRIFSSDNFQQQRRAIDKLFWAGYNSTAFYDAIAEQLDGIKGNIDKDSKERATWYAKALALSGSENYRALLEGVASEAAAKKVRKYATQALERLTIHQGWNPIITQNLLDSPAGRLEEARVKNMLFADDPALLRIGAKRVYHGHKRDAELIAFAKQRLALEYRVVVEGNDEQIDAIAWLIKVMAESGDRTNLALLEEIGANSDVKKVRKYALKYTEYLK